MRWNITEIPHPRKWFVVKCLQNFIYPYPLASKRNSNALPPGQSNRSNPCLHSTPPPSQAFIDRCIIKALFHNKLMVITWILEMGKRNFLWAHICFSFKVTTIIHNYIHACINISFCNTCLIALIFFFNKSTEKDHSIIVWVYTIKLSTLIAMINTIAF